MVWQIEFNHYAKKDLAKLDKQIAKRITNFIRERISTLENPRVMGAALSGSRLGDFWKYRVGDYRIICEIQDQKIKILVIKIGHRSDIYN